jgi:hypothetical protein
MSNEPMPSEPAPGEPKPRASGRSADAELVLAAIDRMEAAIGRERTTRDRLHAGLTAMAQTIAQAKIAVQAGPVKPGAAGDPAPLLAALLDELDHRVDAMLELAGGRRSGPAEPSPHPVNPDPMPAVASAVSQFGRGDEPSRETAPVAATGGGEIPDDSTLEAMVLALSALDVLSQPEAEASTSVTAEPQAFSRPTSAALPEIDFVPAALPEPATIARAAVSASDVPAGAAASAKPDPLAPLNALSPEEKIALFS